MISDSLCGGDGLLSAHRVTTHAGITKTRERPSHRNSYNERNSASGRPHEKGQQQSNRLRRLRAGRSAGGRRQDDEDGEPGTVTVEPLSRPMAKSSSELKGPSVDRIRGYRRWFAVCWDFPGFEIYGRPSFSQSTASHL